MFQVLLFRVFSTGITSWSIRFDDDGGVIKFKPTTEENGLCVCGFIFPIR